MGRASRRPTAIQAIKLDAVVYPLEHPEFPQRSERGFGDWGRYLKGGAKTMCRAVRLMPLIAAISFWSVLGPTARAEEDDTAALAAALKTAKATLQDGLRASKARGTPISAKFEIEDGKLQLSIYTMKGNDFIEVVADPKAGAIAYAQEITDAMDLNEAIEQQAAVAKAKVPLLAAADTAVNENAGSRAVSIVPELKNGQATAEVTLLTGNTFKKVTEKLD
jgi:hypothetical protein